MVDVKSNCIIIELEDIQKKTIKVSFWNTQNLAPLINSNSFTKAYINLKAKINLKFSITIRKKTVKSHTGLATIYYNGENIFNQ
jgi:hypothetical protein